MSEHQPGVMHPVDKAFYDLAVKERDYERRRFDRVEAERDALAARVEELAPLEAMLTEYGLQREQGDSEWYRPGTGLQPEIVEYGTTAAAALGVLDESRAESAMAWDAHSKAMARVEELEARIARAAAVLERTASWDDRITRALVALERPIGSAETWAQYGDNRSNAARRILRGEDDTPLTPQKRRNPE